ncbi:MAG: branched-chain amino acid transporter AzlD [Acidimicrobiaceae bacterium]|nr:branched-chain amino acid transporter AzlD [Acidimicrobiaceae bacterium]|tara:strand:- start:478 stop:795 length:318 start_codon:yes stop_codon:yes gene_type:complete
MSDAVIVMIALAAGTYVLKAFGPLVLSNKRVLPDWLKRFAMLLPTPLLAALVITSTFTSDDQIIFDARIVGVVAAMIALAKRVPFVLVIVIAAAATALWRLITGL